MGYNIQQHLTTVNKGAKGKNTPQWLVVHFLGATGQAWDNAKYFESTYRGASAHYFIDKGNIVQVVEDDRPAWHVGDGSRSGVGKYNGYHRYGATNNNSLGFELCLDTSTHSSVWHMDFHVETLKRAEWLIKQKQKQYNIPNERVIRHFDASGKLCPGNWQYNNWAKWWAFKDRLAGIKASTPTGTVSKDEGKPTVNSKTYLVKTGDTLYKIARDHKVTVSQLRAWNNLDNTLIFPETYLFVAEPKEDVKPVTDIDKLARETIAGKHGNGDVRKKALGNNYNKVMQRVNEILLGNSQPKTAPKPQPKSIDTLVKETLAGKHGNGDARKKSLGSNYNAVMNVINGKSATRRSNTITKKLVDDVIAGKYGNGADREKRLRNAGYDPQAVQREVNKRF